MSVQMQDRYVGDLGDFGKYGLLRHLFDGLRLGVVWYLVANETHNSDGRHVRYLNLDDEASARCGVRPCRPDAEQHHLQHFRVCDPILYDVLQKLVAKGNRDVEAIAATGILPQGTAFV